MAAVSEGSSPTSASVTTREQIDAAIASGDFLSARAALVRFWHTDPQGAAATFVVSRFEKLRGHIPLVPCRLAILRSFTVEPLIPLTRAAAFCGGIDLEIRLGDFNTYHQEVVQPSSWLYEYRPDVAILAVHLRDISPLLSYGFADLSREQIDAEIDRVSAQLSQLLAAFRQRSTARIIVHNFAAPPALANGILDAQLKSSSQASAVTQINEKLVEITGAVSNAYVFDYAGWASRRGSARLEDERKWLTVRLPIAAADLIHLAREWMRFLHPITGRVCKCLVTDLDNTIWGGVIGEDGMDGIKLDSGHRGFAWQSLQRAMLDLYRRGVILAIASKNNPAEAKEAIEKHPGMLLRPEHFSAMRINWNDKAASLREIAAELNIGVDSLAFIDDNPAEREWVASQLPEVTVIALPEDPMLYASTLRDCPQFERLSLTDEDRQRGRMYAEQRIREELQSSSASLEDFYRSLQMVVEIGIVKPATLARTAQLTQKTNQFNLTTKRYSEQQISEFAADKVWRVYTVSVRDRMGDNGLVGVAITRDQAGACQIDTLLLSCRVIGRTVETALLAHIATEAAARGNSRLTGWYLPTKKNPPCESFYRDHGFKLVEQTDSGSRWETDLSAQGLAVPSWIELRIITAD